MSNANLDEPGIGLIILRIIIFLAILLFCFLLILYSSPAYRPLPEYPQSINYSTNAIDSDGLSTETITTFSTNDSPGEVFKFYNRVFLFRIKWRKYPSESGLIYYYNLGCPVGNYSILTNRSGDKTEVRIQLSTTLCY